MPCELEDWPIPCFAKRQRELQKSRYPGEHIICENCKCGRDNAIIAHIPEVDVAPYSRTHGSSRYIPKCAGCGKVLDNRNVSGLCRKCINERYRDEKGRRVKLEI